MNTLPLTLLALVAPGLAAGAPPKTAALGGIRVSLPAIQSFTSSSPAIKDGESITLTASWTGTGSEGRVGGYYAMPNGAVYELWSGSVPIAKGVPITTRAIDTAGRSGQAVFTLTVSSPLGTVTQNIGVSIRPAPPQLLQLTATPRTITEGDPITLAYVRGGGGSPTQFTLTDPGGVITGLSNPPTPDELSPRTPAGIRGIKSYTLTATNAAGSSSQSAQIDMIAAPKIDSFFALPDRINPGESTTLWAAYRDGSAGVVWQGGNVFSPSPLVLEGGSRVVLPPLPASNWFTLSVTNSLGRAVWQPVGVYAAKWQASTGQPLMARSGGHQVTRLKDGRFLISGGASPDGVLDVAELYDPKTRSFTLAGRMTQQRRGHTATLLSNGKVLVAGGLDAYGSPLKTCEIYDPSTSTFAQVPQLMSLPRATHTATALAGGVLLVSGKSADFYDLGTGTLAPAGTPAFECLNHTATGWLDGKGNPGGSVLVVGGAGPSTGAQIYDRASNSWRMAAYQPLTPRTQHAALPLPGGNVLLAGGIDGAGNPLQSLELFHPTDQTFEAAGHLLSLSGEVQASLLPEGAVLFTQAGTTTTEFWRRDGEVRLALPLPTLLAQAVASQNLTYPPTGLVVTLPNAFPGATFEVLLVGADPNSSRQGIALYYQ